MASAQGFGPETAEVAHLQLRFTNKTRQVSSTQESAFSQRCDVPNCWIRSLTVTASSSSWRGTVPTHADKSNPPFSLLVLVCHRCRFSDSRNGFRSCSTAWCRSGSELTRSQRHFPSRWVASSICSSGCPQLTRSSASQVAKQIKLKLSPQQLHSS